MLSSSFGSGLCTRELTSPFSFAPRCHDAPTQALRDLAAADVLAAPAMDASTGNYAGWVSTGGILQVIILSSLLFYKQTMSVMMLNIINGVPRVAVVVCAFPFSGIPSPSPSVFSNVVFTLSALTLLFFLSIPLHVFLFRQQLLRALYPAMLNPVGRCNLKSVDP